MRVVELLAMFCWLMRARAYTRASAGQRGMQVSCSSSPSTAASSSAVVPSGLIAVYKPQNWTSSDVVGKIKYELQRGAQMRAGGRKCRIKVGHGGSLDPLAQGVLVLGIGEGTKMMGEYLSGSKEYLGTGLLGTETDTLDSEGVVTELIDSLHVTRELLESALVSFRGDIMQIPPMYSALKRDGKKLYELARAGIEVERESRPVSIYHLELVSHSPLLGDAPLALPTFGLSVKCSGGTYIRTLIADIARKCEARAHMTSLLRSQQGPFVLSDCLHEDAWTFDRIVAALEATAHKTPGLQNAKNAVVFPDIKR